MIRSSIALLIVVAAVVTSGCRSASPSAQAGCCCDKMKPAVAAGPETDGKSIFDLGTHWQDDDGKPFELASLTGHPVVIGMIFTTCQGICLITRDEMKAVEASLPSSALNQTTFVLVTLDPEHDIPSLLHQYRLDNGLSARRWKLLRGSTPATAKVARWLGVGAGRDASGRFEHTSRITVLDGNGRTVFTQDGTHADLAGAVRAVTQLTGQEAMLGSN